MSSHALDRSSARDRLARLLDAPDLPQIIARLEPEVLHRLVEECGLDACGPLVALATPAQLMQVFDLDLWRSARPGIDERFDADRFGEWLEVLVEAGPSLAAEKLTGLDFDLVTTVVVEQFLVLDRTWSMTRLHPLAESRTFEIGPYELFARHGDTSDAFVTVLTTLETEQPEYFVRLMDNCCRVSVDHVDDNGTLYQVASAGEQLHADLAVEREQRREAQGFVTPSQAAAFLAASRWVRLTGSHPPSRDPVTAGYFRAIERRSGTSGHAAPAASPASARGERHRALPGAGEAARLSSITALMQAVAEADEASFFHRIEELGYLANALAAACTFGGRPLTPAEAHDAALATVNLGLENWPRKWLAGCAREGPPELPGNFLSTQDLVPVFQVGWTILHARVALYAVRMLRQALATLTCRDDDVQGDIVELSRRLEKHQAAGTPWCVRDSLDVVAILDSPSWALLLHLVEQCPAIPFNAGEEGSRPALRVATRFAFISENRQVTWARRFLESLPERLAG
jgi:hypothetical protein